MAGKFEVKAGQHSFTGGEKIHINLPTLFALLNPKSNLCPIKQVYRQAPVPEVAPVYENIIASNASANLSTTATQTANPKCSSHIPKKETNNYSLRFPVKNGYTVDKNGTKTGNSLMLWESIAPRKFDLSYDPSLNKITAKVILQVTFMDAVKVINGISTSVPYDKTEMSQTIQRSVTRTYDPTVLTKLKNKIEQTLNKQITYLTPNQCNQLGGCSCKIPISLEVDFVERGRFHQKVNLYPKSARPNTDNWCEVRLYGIDPRNPVETPIPVNEDHSLAHEVGHYFNFVDEYYYSGGMIHKQYINSSSKLVDLNIPDATNDWIKLSATNLMGEGSKSLTPTIPTYYFNFIKEWFDNKTRIQWNVVL